MKKEKLNKKDIVEMAEKTRHYCDLLVNQCDSWLPEETGKEIYRLKKKQRKKSALQGRNIRFLITVILSVCFSVLAFGQNSPDDISSVRKNHRLDSLLALLPTSGADTTTALLYLDIGQEYEDTGEKEKAREYYLKLKRLSKSLNFYYGYFQYASRYTDILIKDGYYDSIIIISNEALVLAQKMENRQEETIAKLNLGNGYNMKGYYETALNHYFDALRYYEEVRDSSSIGHLYSLLQTVYWDMKRFENAVVYGEKAVALLRHDKRPYLYSMSLLNLANTYSDMHPPQYAKAKESLDKALQIAKENGYLYVEVIAYLNYCDILRQNIQLDKQEEYARRALKMAIEMNDPEILAIAQSNLGYASYHNGHYDEAENWINQGLALALKYDFKKTIRDTYKQLADLSHARHDYRAALTYAQNANSIDNLIVTSEILRFTEEVKIKYETEKKEFEIARQQAVISRQNILRAVLSGGLALTVIILILLWWLLRLRIKRNHALAEMNATKDKFFSIISHDLKNPAIAQRNALQMLIDHRGTLDSESLTQYYAELLQSADGQVELLYNLLNWAQAQTGRMPYVPTIFDFAEAIRSETALIRNMAERKDVKLTVQIPDDAVIKGDRNMLTTVVRNLLTNAVKFTPKGGEVSLDIISADSGYLVSINDTGTGMNDEQLRDLLRIDSRQSKPGTVGEQGSGLGLIVCKELLEKHGCKLNAESVPGKGSRFWFIVAC